MSAPVSLVVYVYVVRGVTKGWKMSVEKVMVGGLSAARSRENLRIAGV